MAEFTLKKEASFLTVSKMANLIITMLTSMLLARFRTLEEYGTYSQLALSLNLITTFSLLGIPNAINYFFPRVSSEEERDKFLQTFFCLNTLLSIVAGILMVISMPIIAWYFDNNGIHGYYYFAIIMPWAKITIQERANFYVASNSTKKLARHTVLNSIILLAIILLTQILKQDFRFYMMLYVFVEMIFAVSVYVHAKRLTVRFKLKIDKNICKQILVFAVPIGISDMVNTLSREVDKLMIGGFLNTEALAIYTNAAREIALTVISTSFIAVMMPKLSKMLKERKKNEAIEIWKSTTSFTYIFMCFGVAALVVFAPQVMSILYSEKYLDGVDVFRIYALVLLWRTTYFGTMLSLNGETKKIMSCSILAMILNIILNYVLYKVIGFCGPAIATFLAISIVNLLQLKLSAKIMEVPVRVLFPWKDILIITIINALVGGPIYIIMQLFKLGTKPIDCIVTVAIGVTWMFLYFCVIMRKRIKKQWREETI